MTEQEQAKTEEQPQEPKQPRIVPPTSIIITSFCFLFICIFGQMARDYREGFLSGLPDGLWFLFNPAVGNLLTLIGGFFALIIPIFWFTVFSGWEFKLRFIPITAIIAGTTLFFTFYKIEHLSGDLVPKFAYRFGSSPDQRLEQLDTNSTPSEKQELKVSEKDFAQFLGPERNLVLPNIELEQNWETNPPKELWRREIGAGWSSFVVVDNYAFTMEQRDQYEYVSCYSASSGEPIWNHSHKARHDTIMGYVGPRSTPTVFKNKVYALGAVGNFVCLNAVTGEVIWQHDLLEMFNATKETEEVNLLWGRANSPLIVSLEDKDLVVLPAGGPTEEEAVSLVAFNAETGKEVWQAGTDRVSYVSPSLIKVDGKQQIASVNEKTITGHDLSTGEILWQTDWPGNSSANANCSQLQSLGDNKFLVTKSYGLGARAFELSGNNNGKYETSILWESPRVLKTKFTNVAIHKGYVYGLSEGILECIDVNSGDRMWRQRGFDHGQLLIVGDSLLVMSEEGDLAIAPASSEGFEATGTIKALYSEISPCWNNLCLYGDMLLVRNAEQAACYQLTLQQEVTKTAEDELNTE